MGICCNDVRLPQPLPQLVVEGWVEDGEGVSDDATWQYWSDYEELTALSRNPFFPVTSKIRSNVSGGFGYFSGYGATYYKVSIADSVALGKVR